MKVKKLYLLFLIFCSMHWSVSGQTREISGQVSSTEDGSSLPGVSVYTKSGKAATVTDVDGRYKISLADSVKSLVFALVGMETKEITIGASLVIDVKLSPVANNLNEVVVGALGVEKKARGLTYATQEISGKEISEVKEVNMINSLAGKSAGVLVTRGAGGVGSSSKVVLRGNKSIQGNNQVLYVIDGIPMNNAVGSQPATLYDAYDGGDAISNLNPDDIETINVLKGASAAALYGSQAANGVIVITTKKGKDGKAKIKYSNNTSFEQAMLVPEIQNKYGLTTPGQAYSESWGAASSSASNAHVKDFFKTGVNNINSISISNGNDKSSFFLSYANTKASGIVPENKLDKHNVNFRGTTSLLNDKLQLDASIKYINQNIANRPTGGYYLNPLVGLYLFPVGMDFSKYGKNNFETFDASGYPVQNWLEFPNEGYSAQNPYWIVNRNPNSLNRNRTISAFSAQYNVLSWLKVQARLNLDRTSDHSEQKLYASTDKILASKNGEYTSQRSNSNQVYSDFIVNMNKQLNEDISVLAAIGTSIMQTNNEGTRMSSYNALGNNIASGLFYQNNFSAQNFKPGFDHREFLTTQFTQAVFATAQLGYKNTVFLDVTARNEWASTIPDARKNPFFYPSVGLSYVLTENIQTNSVLSFAKLRTTYAAVGNALPFGSSNANPPYQIKPDGTILPVNALPLGNLVPEQTKSIEAGFDARFFKDHVSVNFTYYNLLSSNQLFTIIAPPGSGAQFYYINGGDIRNKGFELVAGYKTGDMNGFSWETNINTSRNTNQVIKLSDQLETDQVVVTDYTQTKIYQLVVKEGGSYGDMYGSAFERDGSGNIVKGANGKPVVAQGQDHFLGNPNPKLLMGWGNTLNYKGLAFKFLIDCRFGGKVISMTDAVLDQKGLSQRTADARDAGSITVGGTSFDPKTFYTSVGGVSPVSEQYVYDATNIRMREMSLGYTISTIKGLGDVTLSFVGRNLFFFVNKAPFDPDASLSAGNGLQGLHAFTMPTTRSYGFHLSLSF